MKLVHKNFNFQIKAVDAEKYVIRGVFSTAAEDRHGEIVDQTGWKLDQYKINPVVLAFHDHQQPAVAQCIELGIDDQGQLAGALKFAVDEYDFAKTLFNLYAGRYMRAFSVGFMNNLYEVDQETDQVILRENTLYEISCVNVPANAYALAVSKGIDMEPVDRFMKKQNAEMTVTKALELLAEQPNIDTIKSAITTLEGVVSNKALAQGGAKVETPPERAEGATKMVERVPVALVNKAIRELLKAKKTLSK